MQEIFHFLLSFNSLTIEVFNDKVEVSNARGLLSGITIIEFGKRSLGRNPLIIGLLDRIRIVEQVGSGISRMRNLMLEEDLRLIERFFYPFKEVL